MKVETLIADTEWHPSPDYGRKPLVSVLLPTFRRGASGLFMKAARSVLVQDLEDLELIVVDDASSDGTSGQIATLMAADRRVHCLRHPRNVGLPAVSEYEAFARARADHIAFAFDDDEWEPDALRLLLDESRRVGPVVHGWVDLHVRNAATGDTVVTTLGRRKLPQSLLRSNNFIGNNSLLVQRDVLEDVGLYDPHVVIARLCDWDLLRRIAERYRIHTVDVKVGRELGPATNDSLGHSYLVEPWLAAEWMSLPRNESLRPGRFLDYDVLALPLALSGESRIAGEETARRFSNKWWYRPPANAANPRVEVAATRAESSPSPLPEGRILVVSPNLDASTTLYFDGLEPEVQQRVRIIHGPSLVSGLPEEMVGAGAVVFVRSLFGLAGWIEGARWLGIPHYYFLDDNLMVLAGEPAYRDDYGEYVDAAVSEQLRSFSGVLLSTPALVRYFRERRLHDRLWLYPPVARRPAFAGIPSPPRTAGVTRIGFFGGSHRHDAFRTAAWPALERLSREQPIELVAAGLDRDDLPTAPGFPIHVLPFELSYDLALGTMAAQQIDVLVHPNSRTANNPFKTANVLITAHACGAVPVISDAPPYDALRREGCAVLCGPTTDEWHAGLQRAVEQTRTGRSAIDRLAAYCSREYDGSANRAALDEMLRAHGVPGPVERDARYRSALRLFKTADGSLSPLMLEATLAARVPVPVRRSISYEVRPGKSPVSKVKVPIGGWDGCTRGHVRLRVLRGRSRRVLRESEVNLGTLRSWAVFEFRFEPLEVDEQESVTLTFLPDTDAPIVLFESSGNAHALRRRLLRRVGFDTRGRGLSCSFL